ncbi:MAG: DUF1674 domain-containing protein [Rhodospirillales bacterium]
MENRPMSDGANGCPAEPATPVASRSSTGGAPVPSEPAAEKDETGRPPEVGGPAGPEPTRYGDWERKGRCIDF